eukprot:m.107304 g.107304  ORF g.107304 m.107304 type:complete len:249 (-) comp13922_c0_seq1:2890-3636(-)
MAEDPKTICLFDVDGTLTVARKVITQDMIDTLAALRKKCTVGLVGGSDFVKVNEQMGGNALTMVDYTFAENGLTAYKGETELEGQSFLKFIGEDNLKRVVNWTLKYIADLDIPQKRGTFIEFRNGMLNISPIGRNCSREERNNFEAYDKTANVRKTMVALMEKEFADLGLKFSIGGQISFDVFPIGWDKTYCLRHLKSHGEFTKIHFFGDKTYEGGNDFEIFSSDETIGHTVTSPADTISQLKELFGI